MNRYHLLTVALFASMSLSLYNCRGKQADDELSHHHHHSHSEATAHNHHHHDQDGDEDGHDEEDEDAIVIEPEKAEKLGIEVTQISRQPFTEAIKVTGEVVAPPSSRQVVTATAPGIVKLSSSITTGKSVSSGERIAEISGKEMAGGDVAENYRIIFEAAKRELERLKPLHEQGIVSTLEYNRALTEYEKAEAMLGKSTANKGQSSTYVNAGKSGTISALYVNNGDFVDAGQPIAAIGDNSRLTFRADVPRRYHAKIPMITNAIIETSCGDCESFSVADYNGRKIEGESSVAGNRNGFLPVYFTFNNPGSIEGNGYVESFLQLTSNHQTLAVPKSALTEQQSQWFIYVRIDEDCYEKRPVTIGGSNGELVEIKSGLNEGEEVVTAGVVFVKLAENAGIVPEGHTHNH